MLWLLLLLLGAAALLTIEVVVSWIRGNTRIDSEYAGLVREKLASGEYRVVAGVFNHRTELTARNEWQVEEMDDDLKRIFGRKRSVVLDICDV